MNKVRRVSPYRAGLVFLSVALLIVVVSVIFTNNIARRLADEEHKRIELWAEATRRIAEADVEENIDFYSSIIEDNTTIPVYLTDSAFHLLLYRNVEAPKQQVDAFFASKIEMLRAQQKPIEVHLRMEDMNGVEQEVLQYIFYEDSTLLRGLYFFPYVQFGIIFLFVLIAVVTLYTAQRSEQNRVWVGLTKETAHQLGTPISSLNAWIELLRDRYPEDEMIPQMSQDLDRLQLVAERFSKVGSKPDMECQNLIAIVTDTVMYMRTRISNKVILKWQPDQSAINVMMSRPLLLWVLENLIKNAADAMDGKGDITFTIVETPHQVMLDVSDTGKGIDRRAQKTVFLPGYTTKMRGWGLGLSLAKRIIEEYHRGKIFVKQSIPGEGTTFRIVLEKCKDS